MSSAWVWLTFAIGGVITFLQRGSFILFVGDRELPEPVRRALRYVAPAAFAAIVAPRVLGDDGLSGLGNPDPRLLAAVIAGLFMWRFRNMAAMLVIGMAAFWLLRWIM
jgi:branched-subunit amino acid transport protein